MLQELEVGKTYHIKSYADLLKAHQKYILDYRFCSDPVDYRNQKAKVIASKTVIIRGIGTPNCMTPVTYAKVINSYACTGFSWYIFPHEVVEFGDVEKPNINVF